MTLLHGVRHKWKRLEFHEAERALGVRLAADGNCKAELEFLLSRVNQWADQIRTGCLPRGLVWQSLTTTIMKSIQYPLPATTCSAAECQAILMIPFLKVGLSASGVMSSMARAIVFGPLLRYQGLAIPDLYVSQGVQHHIEKIIRYYLSKDNITGRRIRTSLEATKLAGTGTSTMISIFHITFPTMDTWPPPRPGALTIGNSCTPIAQELKTKWLSFTIRENTTSS
jgi:hypothetical protein